jgi:hypothetical protein
VNNLFNGKPHASLLNVASACGSPLNNNTQYVNESIDCCTWSRLYIIANHLLDRSHLLELKETAP